MRINLKLAASALGLFVVVTASIDGALDCGTEDMHWPTEPVSVQATSDDMHWPTGPTSVEVGISVDVAALQA